MSTQIDAALASGWFGAGLSDGTRARLAALADLASIPAGTVVLREGATVVSFDGPALRAAIDADPALAAAVLWRVLDAVSRRLTATRTQLLDLFSQTDREPW